MSRYLLPTHRPLRISIFLILLGVLAIESWASEKIVNGQETTAWPAVGALLSLPERQIGCTATLIGCQTALTAAHCLCEVEECTVNGPLVPASSLLFAVQGAPAVAITRYDVHPTFSDRTQVDDVAVLHLAEPVTGIAPASINTIRTPPLGSTGIALGYGITAEQAESSAGLKRLGTYSSLDCGADGLPNASNLCFEFRAGGSGICSGDSGGPDFVDLGTGPVLAGLHTAASSCSVGAISLSQDVYSYRSFISQKAGADLGRACTALPLLGSDQTSSQSFTANLTSATASHIVSVPDNIERLRVSLNATEGPNSNLDLSLRRGATPTDTAFDCRSSSPGSFEMCEVASPAAGIWHIRIERRSGGGERYQVLVSGFLGDDPGDDPPAAPTNLQATALSASEIRLEWVDNAENETGFKVERRRAGGNYQPVVTLGAGRNSYLDDGLSPATSYSYRVKAMNDTAASAYSNVAEATTQPVITGPCEPDDQTLCLNQERFQIRVTWRDFENRTGQGGVVPGSSADSGLVYFFDPENWEMLIKVLDGCSYNDRFWVFSAATTNVEYTMTVIDTATGATRSYTNPLGVSAAALTDTSAFSTCP